MNKETESIILNVNEVAKILKLSRGSAYQGCLTGEIPSIRIGRRILVPRIALERILAGAGKPKES